ncbi:hypothetical protein SKAU_G00110620 [Synaphobranchus kaupii]|uniref:Uncharacterized protein n=1 Tax=Synaphobranchus kaupii TaxID=118154 RepID=A0A9Q1G043_SYNKA|nr:hypothetical protein SKAU_G00110620 [Synaphobranchus kaupii]
MDEFQACTHLTHSSACCSTEQREPLGDIEPYMCDSCMGQGCEGSLVCTQGGGARGRHADLSPGRRPATGAALAVRP